MSPQDLLSVNNLRTYFPTRAGLVKAVDSVSFTMRRGSVLGIVGESGSGKTTVAFSIMRLIREPATVSGEIWFDGRNLLAISEDEMEKIRGKELAMVFQDPMTYLNPVMKIGDQIVEGIIIHEKSRKERAESIALKLLEEVRIPSPSTIYDSYPHQLSGGMRQRTLIAMALSCSPTLLIADEPTTALDVTVQAQIIRLLRRLKKERELSLIVISHDLGIVAYLCDQVCVMYAGKVVEYSDVFSLYKDPKHPYTQALLKSALSIDEFKEKLVVIEGTVPNLVNPPSGCKFHPRCPYAMSICAEEEPPMLKRHTGAVACWLYK